MQRFTIVVMIAALLSLAAAGCAQEKDVEPTSEFLLGGVQVNESEIEHWLDRLEAQGMNTVSVTDYAHQGDWDSYNLWWDEENEGLRVELRAAKERGLRVVLILRVALDHAFERNAFLWHGMIMPSTEDQLDEWFRRYREFSTRWAKIAESEGVDALFISSELNALTSTVPLEELPALEEYYLDREKQKKRREETLEFGERIEERHLILPEREGFEDLDDYLDARIQTEESWAATLAPGAGDDPEVALEAINARRARLEKEWRGIIAAMREHYSGPLGYAANFDQYQDVGFWDDLDLIGINAYFSLREEVYPYRNSQEIYRRLEEGWRGVLGEIQEMRRERGLLDKPVIFTELGYTYRANSTIEPWAATGFSLLETTEGEKELKIWQDEPIDHRERAMALRALWSAHRELDPPLLAGLLYWKLSTVESHYDIEPFVILIDEVIDDPVLDELRRFRD